MLRKIFVLVTMWVCGTVGQCPPADLLFPCVCGDFATITCSNWNNSDVLFDLKAIFDRISPTIDEAYIFGNLEIRSLPNEEIPEETLETLKFETIYITDNPNLRFIHPNAFNQTLSVTKSLYIMDNRNLSNVAPEHDQYDVFNFINKFANVEDIHMHGNDIRSVPDNALDSNPNLLKFYFSNNHSVSYLGSKAFSKLSNLEVLGLRGADLTLEEIAENAFQGIVESAVVDLQLNLFTRLPETIFKPLLDTVKILYVGGSPCGWNCPDLRLDCDEMSHWICDNVPRYKPKLYGFLCQESSGFQDIFEYCANQTLTV